MPPVDAPLLPGFGPAPQDPLVLPDGRLTWLPAFLGPDEADSLLARCLAEVDWRQEEVQVFGRRHRVPRLTAWQGETAYGYSGLMHPPTAWSPFLLEVKARVEQASASRFNGVLLNRYRDGRDAMGWHADDEPELGSAPVLASLSLGATRTFQLRHRTRTRLARVDLELTHGSLLVMHPPTQQHWMHALPRRAAVTRERVNLTFRLVTA
jgi:alkylated DNA repair dioxygenase AlkB